MMIEEQDITLLNVDNKSNKKQAQKAKENDNSIFISVIFRCMIKRTSIGCNDTQSQLPK